MTVWNQYTNFEDSELIADADTLLMRNLSDTTQSGDGSVNEITYELLKANILNGVKAYGATGDGITNDHAAIQAILTEGGWIYLPLGTYIVNGGLSTSETVYLFGPGTLKVAAGQDYDAVLTLTGDDSRVEGIAIDQSLTASNTGINDGLVISADGWTIRDVKVTGDGNAIDTGDTFDLTGSGLMENCYSVNASRIGCRVHGDGTDSITIINNFTATNWRAKGIAYDGTGYSLVIDGAILTTSATDADSTPILVDVSTDSLREVFINNVIASGASQSNSGLKITNDAGGSVDYAYLSNLQLYGTSASNGITLSHIGQVEVRNLYIEDQVDINTYVTKADIYSMTIDMSTVARNYGVNARTNGQMRFKDCKIKGYTTHAFRYTESDDTYLILDNIEEIGAAAADQLISVSNRITPGRVQLGSIIIATGDTAVHNGFTGSTTYEVLLQRNIGQRPRIFRANASPTWVAEQGDICYDYAPVSGAPLGWIQLDRYDTTVDGNEVTGQTVISVADAAGIADTDIVGILLDDGAWHWSSVDGAPVGNDITIADALPSQASDGVAFIAGGWNALANLA